MKGTRNMNKAKIASLKAKTKNNKNRGRLAS